MIRLAALALILAASPAAAQSLCGARDTIVGHLAGKYGETRLGHGLQPGRGVLEFYASPGGSWTAILTLPTGMACVVATGEAWVRDVPAEIVGDPT